MSRDHRGIDKIAFIVILKAMLDMKLGYCKRIADEVWNRIFGSTNASENLLFELGDITMAIKLARNIHSFQQEYGQVRSIGTCLCCHETSPTHFGFCPECWAKSESFTGFDE